MTKKMLSKVALLLLAAMPVVAQVPVKGSTVNATVGFQYQGGAPSGWQLCGNGSTFIAAASCGASAFYQIVASNGSGQPQRPILNFSSRFVIGTTGSTEVDLASVGSAGSCAYPTNITTDIYGRITAYTCGSAPVIAGVLSSNLVGSRSIGGGPYTNSGASMFYASGYVTTSGSGFTRIDCVVNGATVFANQFGATSGGFPAGFGCMVPAGASYQITSVGGSATLTLAGWYETILQ